MPTDPPHSSKRPLTPEAERALAEAEARRAERAGRSGAPGQKTANEINGPSGLEPTRYGDWEKDGIASDF